MALDWDASGRSGRARAMGVCGGLDEGRLSTNGLRLGVGVRMI